MNERPTNLRVENTDELARTSPSILTRPREDAAERLWYLEGFLEGSHSLRRLALNVFPYRIGRKSGLELRLASPEISRLHAQIEQASLGLVLRDLDSTNGTYVNHEPVHDATQLREGDIIQLGAVEMRLVVVDAERVALTGATSHGTEGPLSENLPTGTRELQELLLEDRVTGVFQPIFTCDGELHGWEILGRGNHPVLPQRPADLFRIAESVDKEVMLSHSFRRVGLELAATTVPEGLFFLNIHPRELEEPDLLLSNLETCRGQYPQLQMVVELHEAAFTDLNVLRKLQSGLERLNIRLAFDDFGAGQARLLELAEAPPHYIKVDISLIRQLDKARESRRKMVEFILEVAHRSGCWVVAEGVERNGEADACRAMGFDLLQGFLLGGPQPEARIQD